MKSYFFAAAFYFASALALGANYTVTTDIEYSKPGGESLKLDAHVPEGKGPFPTVILVHGGGWTGGTKTANFVQPLFPVLDRTGYAWFTLDYRLAPKHPYPAAIDDVEAAIAWVKSHSKEYKVDPKRIALMGESAGGHLVNLAGARNKGRVKAVVCFYGPIDLIEFTKQRFGDKPLDKNMTGFFGIKDRLDDAGAAKLREASPNTYLGKQTPPFLLIHGTKDEAVPYAQSTQHMALMKKIGKRCDRITVQDGIHGVINWEKDLKFQGYKDEMIAWLKKAL